MPMKVAVLFSGGKDSTFTVYQCQKKGYDIRWLVSMVPENPESYMFHHPNIGLAGKLAKSMGIPIVVQETKGIKEKELADLQKALLRVRRDVDGVVVGGIASKYQADRIAKACQSLGLKFLAPLWNMEPVRYWRMLLSAGFEVMIISVSAEGLGKEWLGRVIDNHAIKELKALSKRFKFHMAFEGGEAETLVLDAPMFSKRLLVLEAKTDWDVDSGRYLVKDFMLVDKKAISRLRESYDERKKEIKARLDDFSSLLKGSEWETFEEMCFCLCTPQSKAVKCDKAIKRLVKNRMLFKGSDKDIANALAGKVRFHNQKAKNIVKARQLFTKKGILCPKGCIDRLDVPKTRKWLVDNVRGMGYKESSHFLRNIGLGRDIAILDRHILKNLARLGAIDSVPKSLTTKKYLELEERMRKFAEAVGIQMDELDLLFWSEETGHVFK